MQKLIMAFLFCLGMMSTIANADPIQRRKVVVCDETSTILNTVRAEFGEEPIWYAKDGTSPTQYIITVNPAEDTWTLIQFDRDQACILGVGSGSKLLVPLGKPS